MKQLLATALLSCACVCAHAQTAEELINKFEQKDGGGGDVRPPSHLGKNRSKWPFSFPQRDQKRGVSMAVKKLGHVGIFAQDFEKMRDFYSKTIGLTVTDETPPDADWLFAIRAAISGVEL